MALPSLRELLGPLFLLRLNWSSDRSAKIIQDGNNALH